MSQDRLTDMEVSLLRFWLDRRGNRRMPLRAEMPAEDLYPWMGFLHLLEPVEGGADFLYRVYASRSRFTTNREMNGKRVTDWNDARVAPALALYQRVMTECRPIYSAVPERDQHDWVSYSRLALPLGNDEGVTHIIVMLTHDPNRRLDSIPPTPMAL